MAATCWFYQEFKEKAPRTLARRSKEGGGNEEKKFWFACRSKV
jgi:hypothetical protein